MVTGDRLLGGTKAWDVLAAVADPEIPVLSVVDLGIVRDVVESDDGSSVVVTLTPTYSGCPATEVIASDVEAALGRVYDEVLVITRLSPAWTTDWMSEAGRAKLAEFGIAPPPDAVSAEGRRALAVVDAGRGGPERCPHCGSAHVEELSAFGSTPCKALWRCATCREPFDWFKAH
jgi:ring-1,2-phenylacetyl-CoA epoxidase subunit PaaD